MSVFLKEIDPENLNNLPKENKEAVIDDNYVKKAVIDSNLQTEVKLYIIEKIFNSKKEPQFYHYYDNYSDKFKHIDANKINPPNYLGSNQDVTNGNYTIYANKTNGDMTLSQNSNTNDNVYVVSAC